MRIQQEFWGPNIHHQDHQVGHVGRKDRMHQEPFQVAGFLDTARAVERTARLNPILQGPRAYEPHQ